MQMVFEIVERAVADVERRDVDLAVFCKLEARQAAESRDVLILFADRLLQNLDLDLAGFFGHHGRIDVFALKGVHRAQQPDGESARRSQARAGGNIRHADHFDGRTNVVHPQRFPDQRMADVVERDGVFERGVFQEVPAAESFVDADVDMFVDGR